MPLPEEPVAELTPEQVAANEDGVRKRYKVVEFDETDPDKPVVVLQMGDHTPFREPKKS